MSRFSILLAVPMLACGYERSNPVDLGAIAGVPARIEQVRFRHSLSSGLGATPVTLSGADGPNSIGVDFDVVVDGQLEPYSGVSATVACAVDGRTIVSELAADAGRRLENEEIGGRVEGSEVLFPSAFVTAIPSVCEARFFYTVATPLTSDLARPPNIAPLLVGTACYADKQLRVGPCTNDELPRQDPGVPWAVTDVHGHIAAVQSGDHSLLVTALVTAGQRSTGDTKLRFYATCRVGDEDHPAPLFMFINGMTLGVGESTTETGIGRIGAGAAAADAACTVTAKLEDAGAATPAGQWCVIGNSVESGPC